MLLMEYGHEYEELLVEPGYKAPDIKLRDENGKAVSLYGSMDDRNMVLVFIRAVDDQHTGQQVDYLKDSFERIKFHHADVLAVSYGSVSFNKKLVDEHELPFHVLSDRDCTAIKKYTIYSGPEKLLGPNVFILNSSGLITYMYNGKNPSDIVEMADIINVLHEMEKTGGTEIYGGVADRID